MRKPSAPQYPITRRGTTGHGLFRRFAFWQSARGASSARQTPQPDSRELDQRVREIGEW